MKLPENTPMLSLDSPTFAEDLANALGIQPGETIQIVTPQFERTDGLQVPIPMFSPQQWANLPRMEDETLKQLGLGIWDKDNNGTHWLFPKEWYSIIPNGLMVTVIDGKEEPFVRGKTDDDCRFGMLAYGFIKRAA